MATDAVIYQRHPTADGQVIIQATLNSERSLNALNQQMIDSLLPALEQWRDDDAVVAVLLDSVGDKAFCAGGDVVELYHAMACAPGTKQPFVQQYFAKEYELDYKIHTFEKPIIVWGNGFVMGGGLGLMAGASHRVVTEHSKVAMPEITIGLYPDVGGTYFLSRMRNRIGLFLGLTAAQMNAADCLEVGLADHYLAHQQKESVIAQLTLADWSRTKSANGMVTELLNQLDSNELAVGNLASHRQVLDKVLAPTELADVIDAIAGIETEDKWLAKAQRALAHGSLLSAKILQRQLDVGQSLSLAQCFELELSISVHCGEFGEVTEGIRALLIDRDNAPQWKYQSLAQIDDSLIDRIFSPAWDDESHPLQLG